MLNMEQVRALKRVIIGAALMTQPPLEDLTEAELIADDLEAAVVAYETWIDDEAKNEERKLAANPF